MFKAILPEVLWPATVWIVLLPVRLTSLTAWNPRLVVLIVPDDCVMAAALLKEIVPPPAVKFWTVMPPALFVSIRLPTMATTFVADKPPAMVVTAMSPLVLIKEARIRLSLSASVIPWPAVPLTRPTALFPFVSVTDLAELKLRFWAVREPVVCSISPFVAVRLTKPLLAATSP